VKGLKGEVLIERDVEGIEGWIWGMVSLPPV